MGLAISQLTTQMVMDVRSSCEYQLTLIMNSLQSLTRQSQGVVEEQSRAAQAYMSKHPDEEGGVDISAVEYINSAAFSAKFDAQLKAIQAKEQVLDLQKLQLETKQKMYTTQEEGWEKTIDKNISTTFKYGQ